MTQRHALLTQECVEDKVRAAGEKLSVLPRQSWYRWNQDAAKQLQAGPAARPGAPLPTLGQPWGKCREHLNLTPVLYLQV